MTTINPIEFTNGDFEKYSLREWLNCIKENRELFPNWEPRDPNFSKMNFRVFQENGKQMIESLIYPRFIGEITFEGDWSAIGNIKFLTDKIHEEEALAIKLTILAKLLEAEDFLMHYTPEEKPVEEPVPSFFL